MTRTAHRILNRHALGLALTVALLGQAHAGPVAAVGTEGLSLIATGGEVWATYQGSTAGFNNVLFLEGRPELLFNNRTTADGTEVSLGSFAAGTELVFRMNVNLGSTNYYTGPGQRNDDGLPHARAQAEWAPGVTLVSFEDLGGLPEGANGYADLSFSLRGVSVSAVPEPTGLVLAVAGMMAAVGLRRKHAH
jgi:hypothetical protein